MGLAGPPTCGHRTSADACFALSGRDRCRRPGFGGAGGRIAASFTTPRELFRFQPGDIKCLAKHAKSMTACEFRKRGHHFRYIGCRGDPVAGVQFRGGMRGRLRLQRSGFG